MWLDYISISTTIFYRVSLSRGSWKKTYREVKVCLSDQIYLCNMLKSLKSITLALLHLFEKIVIAITLIRIQFLALVTLDNNKSPMTHREV